MKVINEVKLSSELAANDVAEYYEGQGMSPTVIATIDGNEVYTPGAQVMFNNRYDYYRMMIDYSTDTEMEYKVSEYNIIDNYEKKLL